MFAVLGSIIGSGLLIHIFDSEGTAIIMTASTITGVSSTLFHQTLVVWLKMMGTIMTTYLLCRDGQPQMALASCFASPMIGKVNSFGSRNHFKSIIYVAFPFFFQLPFCGSNYT